MVEALQVKERALWRLSDSARLSGTVPAVIILLELVTPLNLVFAIHLDLVLPLSFINSSYHSIQYFN